jgi:hypothetical protein
MVIKSCCFSGCVVVIYALFKAIFVFLQTIEKLYFSSRLQYLSFGINITFISLVV